MFASLGVMACSSGNNEDDATEGNGVLKETVTQRSCSISEGAEVDAATTTTITLAYNTTVSVSSNANITLNGTKVTAQKGAVTAMNIDIPVTLEAGTSYTLSVPSGSVLATSDATRTAPAFTLNFTTKKAASKDIPDNEATALTRKLGFMWNLGNHFDSHNNGAKSGWWDGATPTEALYKALAAAGVKTVRIPVTWGPYEGEAPSYTIESELIDVVKQNVEWAKNAGLNVILNTHHDEYWLDIYSGSINSTTNASIEARITATWTQIAEAFKDEGDYLIFEAFNEIQDGGWGYGKSTSDGGKQYKLLNEWNQTAVNAIRATGGNNAKRWIAVHGYAASPTHTMNYMTLPDDTANKIIVAVHSYNPSSFTISDPLDETWGHNANKATDETDLQKIFSDLKAAYIDNNIPCYMDEFGCSCHTTTLGEKCRAYYLEYFCRLAHNAGIAVGLWDNFYAGAGPEHHAYFSHNDGSWMDGGEKLVKMMIKAATSNDDSYTIESIYNTAPRK